MKFLVFNFPLQPSVYIFYFIRATYSSQRTFLYLFNLMHLVNITKHAKQNFFYVKYSKFLKLLTL
jgi:hypothetical protein